MGGGGFTMEPGGSSLDDFVLRLGRRAIPRICFLATASGDLNEQIVGFYGAYGDRPCEPAHLSLFRLGTRPVDVEALLLAQDVIYVGGGSMRNLIAIWRTHDLDRILRRAWESGVVLAGLSAGAMCWFEGGVSKSGGRPEATAGLGMLPGSLSVHDDSEPERRPAYLAAVAAGTLPDGYAVDDGVGLLYRGRRLERIVAARPGMRCRRVLRRAGGAVEEPVEVELLPDLAEVERRGSADVRELRALRYGPMAGR